MVWNVSFGLGLALWLIGEDLLNGQGGDVTVLVHSLSDYFSRIQPTYDNGSCLYKFTVTSLHVNHSGMILGWVKQVGCMQRFPVIR